MITCKIKIEEHPGKGFLIEMIPEQANGTLKELAIAGCIDVALRPIFHHLMSIGSSAEMMEWKESEAAEKLAEEMNKRFRTRRS
jgi:hypothetical protein